MSWKTCSVEAGGGIGKRCATKRLFFSQSESGMQKHGLTMFAATCYSSLVPRVHPGLLCAVSFWRDCARQACSGAIEKRNAFPDEVQVRRHSSLKRSCGAFRPIMEGYAGQG